MFCVGYRKYAKYAGYDNSCLDFQNGLKNLHYLFAVLEAQFSRLKNYQGGKNADFIFVFIF